MITRVHVKNFRSLADVDVELGPLTVLVGRNGAGKSAFVDLLGFVRDALHIGLDGAIKIRGGIASLRRYDSKTDLDIEITVSVRLLTLQGEYSLTIGSEDNAYYVRREKCVVTAYDMNSTTSSIIGREAKFEIHNGKWTEESTIQVEIQKALSELAEAESSMLILPRVLGTPVTFAHIHRFLTSTRVYNIYPEALRIPQKRTDETLLAEDGSNFASVLSRIEREGRIFSDLRNPLCHVVTGVGDIRSVLINGYNIAQLEHCYRGGQSCWFDLSQESDGALRFLALLVVLYQEMPTNQSRPRRLVGIEEPELILYPGAMGVLSDVIRESAQRQQILITTQSPDLISRFDISDLRIVEQEDGITMIGPISETQREAINLQLFSSGDLLRIEGLHRAPVTLAGEEYA